VTIQNKYILCHQIILSEVEYFPDLQNQLTSINYSAHYLHDKQFINFSIRTLSTPSHPKVCPQGKNKKKRKSDKVNNEL
jgi:hypothetical protein